MTLVVKFGGTSVGSAAAMRQTAELILQDRAQWGSIAVIASAMGSKPVKVTDLLLKGANAAANGDNSLYQTNTRLLQEIHDEAIEGLLTTERESIKGEIGRFIERYADLCSAVYILGELSLRALDAIAGMGEQMSIRILAAYLRELGYNARAIDATELIVTNSNFTHAIPDLKETGEKARTVLQPFLAEGGIPIITGFIAADTHGVMTTLGRGGSDYSAAIIGHAIGAQEVWIWTDVDGVLSADPRLVPNAKPISILTNREISELAYYGAQVLHPKTIRPCVENNIPLRIKNTFNPIHPGTLIVEEMAETPSGIRAVTAIKGLRLITIEGKGMMGVTGVAARTFRAVADADVNVLLITQASSEQSICFATSAGTAHKSIVALEKEFAREIENGDIDRVWAINDAAIVTVVGAGMRGTPGVAGGVFTVLGQARINIVAIAQGSSECSISLVVHEGDANQAVSLIHTLIP